MHLISVVNMVFMLVLGYHLWWWWLIWLPKNKLYNADDNNSTSISNVNCPNGCPGCACCPKIVIKNINNHPKHHQLNHKRDIFKPFTVLLVDYKKFLVGKVWPLLTQRVPQYSHHNHRSLYYYHSMVLKSAWWSWRPTVVKTNIPAQQQ